jgi:hypothetical protein
LFSAAKVAVWTTAMAAISLKIGFLISLLLHGFGLSGF